MLQKKKIHLHNHRYYPQNLYKMSSRDLYLHIVKWLILICIGMLVLHRVIKPVCIDKISVCLLGINSGYLWALR